MLTGFFETCYVDGDYFETCYVDGIILRLVM